MEASASKITPGQMIDFTLTSRPNSFIGLMAVDQNSVKLKSGENFSRF